MNYEALWNITNFRFNELDIATFELEEKILQLDRDKSRDIEMMRKEISLLTNSLLGMFLLVIFVCAVFALILRHKAKGLRKFCE